MEKFFLVLFFFCFVFFTSERMIRKQNTNPFHPLLSWLLLFSHKNVCSFFAHFSRWKVWTVKCVFDMAATLCRYAMNFIYCCHLFLEELYTDGDGKYHQVNNKINAKIRWKGCGAERTAAAPADCQCEWNVSFHCNVDSASNHIRCQTVCLKYCSIYRVKRCTISNACTLFDPTHFH